MSFNLLKEAKMKEKNQRISRVLTAKQFIKKIKIVMEPVRSIPPSDLGYYWSSTLRLSRS